MFVNCHWNLNSISAHGYSKLFLLKACNSVHKLDIIYLSETYIDSCVPLDDESLVICEYNLVRSDIHLIPKTDVSVSTIKTIYH